MKLLAFVVASALSLGTLVACGGTQQCNTTCDCKQTDKPTTCTGGGEWVCNTQKTCEFTCQPACSGQVYTCPDETDCNGTFCSARKVAQCAP